MSIRAFSQTWGSVNQIVNLINDQWKVKHLRFSIILYNTHSVIDYVISVPFGHRYCLETLQTALQCAVTPYKQNYETNSKKSHNSKPD